ncbi:hypothetical protein Acr_00g0003270 [Actinidia rufa]|uniref:Uncharacterized protein n=1 Tax=Actinidia rufa TaxID=165716 RepID=A0A7J0D7S8_9ERIC|nr:hypothetical protein Acr_00g0000880 [Actinidia rufa]GFS28263.1 hypothetical protein Acr_00g0000890 [Actinidia rufa]GFS28684.1 hypothetical protein Acr_00g0003270 [Actinidia rufa]
MPSPRNLKELRSLPGRLQPLISKARTRCQSFSRQDANFVWTPKHKERGFNSLLRSSPVGLDSVPLAFALKSPLAIGRAQTVVPLSLVTSGIRTRVSEFISGSFSLRTVICLPGSGSALLN